MRRPSSFDDGVEQLRKAVDDTPASVESEAPRAKVWRACFTLLKDDFLRGMRALYEANAIVSCLFNTIVPHIDERLRYDTLQVEYDKAAARPESVEQNRARFRAILGELASAEGASRQKTVDVEFAAMRDAMRCLHANHTVVEGLGILYVSSKTARTALDLIFDRLVESFRNDTSIVQTTDVPIAAMMLK